MASVDSRRTEKSIRAESPFKRMGRKEERLNFWASWSGLIVWFFVRAFYILPEPFKIWAAGIAYYLAALSVVLVLFFFYAEWLVKLPSRFDKMNTFLSSFG